MRIVGKVGCEGEEAVGWVCRKGETGDAAVVSADADVNAGLLKDRGTRGFWSKEHSFFEGKGGEGRVEVGERLCNGTLCTKLNRTSVKVVGGGVINEGTV